MHSITTRIDIRALMDSKESWEVLLEGRRVQGSRSPLPQISFKRREEKRGRRGEERGRETGETVIVQL